MWHFFDYIYYRACRFYENSGESEAPVSGLAVIMVLHSFNVIIIYGIICMSLQTKLVHNKWVFSIVPITMFILNGIRYNKITYATLKDRWEGETASGSMLKQTFALIYIVASVILCLSVAIYLGSKKDW